MHGSRPVYNIAVKNEQQHRFNNILEKFFNKGFLEKNGKSMYTITLEGEKFLKKFNSEGEYDKKKNIKKWWEKNWYKVLIAILTITGLTIGLF